MLAWPLIFRGLILRSLFLGTHKKKCLAHGTLHIFDSDIITAALSAQTARAYTGLLNSMTVPPD